MSKPPTNLREQHEEARALAELAACHGARIGLVLLEVRAQLGHARFRRWLVRDCPIPEPDARHPWPEFVFELWVRKNFSQLISLLRRIIEKIFGDAVPEVAAQACFLQGQRGELVEKPPPDKEREQRKAPLFVMFSLVPKIWISSVNCAPRTVAAMIANEMLTRFRPWTCNRLDNFSSRHNGRREFDERDFEGTRQLADHEPADRVRKCSTDDRTALVTIGHQARADRIIIYPKTPQTDSRPPSQRNPWRSDRIPR